MSELDELSFEDALEFIEKAGNAAALELVLQLLKEAVETTQRLSGRVAVLEAAATAQRNQNRGILTNGHAVTLTGASAQTDVVLSTIDNILSAYDSVRPDKV